MRRLMVGAFALAVLAGGCGDDGDDGASAEDRDRAVSALVADGSSEEHAQCIVDALGPDDAERMMSADQSELSESETGKYTQAAIDCMPEPGEEGSPADALDEVTTASADLDQVQTCLEDAGFDVSNASSDTDPGTTGATGALGITSSDGELGTGTVTLYDLLTDADDARKAAEEGAGDDVEVGQRGTVVYSIVGEGADLVEGCL